MRHRGWWVSGAAVMMLVVALVIRSQHGDSTTMRQSIESGVEPTSIAGLVANADAIVVGRFIDLVAVGTQVLATPDATPASSGVATSVVLDPTSAVSVVGTHLVIDQILKNDGNLQVNDTVLWETYGAVPVDATETAKDAASEFPLVWPEDTEFVVFMRLNYNSGRYFVAFGPDGRILTSGDQVTASNAGRTVRPFVEGMDRAAFIDAVATAVAQPTPTP